MRRVISVFAWDLRPGDVVLDEMGGTPKEIIVLERRFDPSDGTIYIQFSGEYKNEASSWFFDPTDMFKMVLK